MCPLFLNTTVAQDDYPISIDYGAQTMRDYDRGETRGGIGEATKNGLQRWGKLGEKLNSPN